MTGKEFLIRISNGESDILQELLSILEKTGSHYCLIGGLAVNAYVEPVVSLDLDLIVAADEIDKICEEAEKRGFKLEKFEHSITLRALNQIYGYSCKQIADTRSSFRARVREMFWATK